MGPNGLRLTPRKSFEAWAETVRGRSKPWTETELQIAESLRIMLLEVVVRLSGAAEEHRKASSARQDLLIAELNHRVRNILGLIRALVARSKESATSLEHFVKTLSDRIFSLAQAHDMLTADQWRPVSLRGLLSRELDAYLGREKERVTLSGPPILIEPAAFSVMALVFHELTTNAAKYGALRDHHGKVSITWALDDMEALSIEWRESGGPAVRPPSRQGFGTTIIERSIPFELQGEADVRYELSGLNARFMVPSRFVLLGQDDATAIVTAETEAGVFRFEGPALVVEDNALIALDAEHMLRELGFQPIEIAGNLDQAGRLLLQYPDLKFVLLDVNLAEETSFPFAQHLQQRNIPFAFASGYGDQMRLPPDLTNARMLSKPYRFEMVAKVVRDAGVTPMAG